MTHPEVVRVSVGELLPGSQGADPFPYYEMGWDAWENTFKFLDTSPEAYFPEWPIYPFWKAWCMRRFGQEPCMCSRPGNGRAWSWPCFESGFRRAMMSFKRHGYKPDMAFDGERITAVIRDDGKLALEQGNKRVALLRAFVGHHVMVDVRISKRTAGWLEFKEMVFGMFGKQQLYHPIPHPDFCDWAVSQTPDRLARIRKRFPKTEKLLDLGCHTGYMTRGIPSIHASGVDSNPTAIKVAEWINQYLGLSNPHYAVGDICKFIEDCGTYDVCLCLGVMMHVFGKHGFDAGWKVLKIASQKCPVMFFDIGFGGYSGQLPFSSETLKESILSNTDYTGHSVVGVTAYENRPLHLFWRA